MPRKELVKSPLQPPPLVVQFHFVTLNYCIVIIKIQLAAGAAALVDGAAAANAAANVAVAAANAVANVAANY